MPDSERRTQSSDQGARSIEPLSCPIFICEIEQFAGAERSLVALSRWLSIQGLPNYLLTYHDRCNIAQFATHPLRVVELNPEAGAWARISSLKRHVQSRRPEAPAILCSGYQPALHATLAGIRGFHDIMHDTPSLFEDREGRSLKARLRTRVSNAIAGFGLRSGGATIVNSEFLRAECLKDFGVKAQIVRMGGLAVDGTTATPKQHGGSKLSMLSVSRIEPNKRIDWLIRSLAILEKSTVAPLSGPLSSVVDWHLEIVGKGPQLAQLTDLSIALGIGDRVNFHGFVPDLDLEKLYARADIFLMPAVQGYGIPAVEALQRGIPVLLHRESGVSDILLDTPWATVLRGDETELPAVLAGAIKGILAGDHLEVPTPHLPTEDGWAEEVARICHWL